MPPREIVVQRTSVVDTIGMAMVAAPPAAAGGSQTAFTYSSEPQAVPPKRSSVRSKYREDGATTPDAAQQWMDENDVGSPCVACGSCCV